MVSEMLLAFCWLGVTNKGLGYERHVFPTIVTSVLPTSQCLFYVYGTALLGRFR